MQLKDLVARYHELADGYDRPIHPSELGLPTHALERELSALEDDYHISRFLRLTRPPAPANRPPHAAARS